MSARPVDPDEEDVIRAWIEKYLEELHTAMPGRVESYDAATQTANVLPLVRHASEEADGSTAYEDLPVVPCVPIVFPRVGQWFVGMKIVPGDTVLLVSCESAIGHWWAGSGDPEFPGDLRRHHLAHTVAIPGLFPRSKKLAHAPASESGAPGIVIGSDASDGTRITFGAGGELVVTRGTNTVLRIDADGTVHLGGHPAAQFVALAEKVDAAFSSLKSIFNAWVPVPNDGGAVLKTALTAWNPATVAASKTRAT